MKVVAGDITNLTDARYYSAWHIEALVYVLEDDSEASMQKLKEIVNWVEGPKPVLGIDMLKNINLGEVLNELNIKGVMTSSEALYGTDSYILRDSFDLVTGTKAPQILDFQLNSAEINLLKTHSGKAFVTIENNDVELIKELYIQYSHIGLYLKGGPEEKVGYKSYDIIDDLLDTLSINS